MRSPLLAFLVFGSAFAFADSEAPSESSKPQNTLVSPFTGRISKNKVRMRAQPTLDASVIRELSKGDMLIVAGESDDFYTVLPPMGSKAYIFRTFVLDNVVEGTKVNVRLEPNVDSPIIAQLNTGDKVNGIVSPLNSKWLEIPMPSTARFYVAKEYIEKIGDAQFMANITKKRDEINQLLSNTYLISQDEMQKNYPDVKLDGIIRNYNRIMDQSKDFPEQAARAKELLQVLQDNYLQKKIAYLELKAHNNSIGALSQPQPEVVTLDNSYKKPLISSKMSAWNDAEEAAFHEWQEHHAGETMEQFYADQLASSKTLKGIVEPYTKAIKNKPGDFVLVNPVNHAIIAYLYSNKVNVADHSGQEITIKAAPRPNNNFAFPAYFVLDIEE